MQEFDQLISILIAEPDYLVQEIVGEYDDLVERAPEVVDGKKQKVLIAGSLISLLESLDSEVRIF